MGLEVLTTYIKEGRKSSPKEFGVSNDGIQRLKRYSQDAGEYEDKLSDIRSTINPENPFNARVIQEMVRAMHTWSRFRALSNELEQGNKADELLGLIYTKDEASHEHLESQQIRQALRRRKTIRLVPPQK